MRAGRWGGDVIAGVVVFLFAVGLLVAASRIPPTSFEAEVVGPKAMPVAVGVALAVSAVALVVKGLREAARPRAGGSTQAPLTGERRTGGDTGPEGAPAAEEAAGAGAGEAAGEAAGADGGTRGARRLLVLAAMFLGYILVFIPVGYPVATFAFLLAVTMFLDAARWRRNIAYAVVFPLVVYVLFTQGLQVQLPAGILG